MRRPYWLALFVLTACTRAVDAGLPPVAADPHARRPTTASLKIKIPHPRRTHTGQRPAYVSPATASLSYAVDGGSPANVALSTSSPACAPVRGALLCTVPIAVPPGAHTFSFSTYDAEHRLLSADTNVPYDVKPGKLNPIAVTLGGVATSLSIAAPVTPAVTGTQAGGFSIYGNAPLGFTIVAKDADGDTIVGPGAPTPVLSPLPLHVTVASPPPTHANVWTLTSAYQAADPVTGIGDTLAVSASPVPDSGGTTVTASVPLTLYQPWVYVTNSNNTITVYDELGNQKTVSGTFPNLNSPRGVAYDPHDGLLYVANLNGGNVTAYDRLGHQHALAGAGLAAFADPRGVTYDAHNNLLYVAGDNAAGAYDEAGNAQTLSGTFPNLNKATGMVYDPHDGFIYIVNNDGYNCTAYDEQGNQQTLAGSWPGLFPPYDIDFDPDTNALYVTIELPVDGGPGVVAFDEQGRSLGTNGFRRLVGAAGLAYDTWQAGLFVVDTNGTLPFYSAAGAQLSVGQNANLFGPHGVAVVP